jgi:hypothetical protein
MGMPKAPLPAFLLWPALSQETGCPDDCGHLGGLGVGTAASGVIHCLRETEGRARALASWEGAVVDGWNTKEMQNSLEAWARAAWDYASSCLVRLACRPISPS